MPTDHATSCLRRACTKPQLAMATSGKVRRPALRSARSRFQPIGKSEANDEDLAWPMERWHRNYRLSCPLISGEEPQAGDFNPSASEWEMVTPTGGGGLNNKPYLTAFYARRQPYNSARDGPSIWTTSTISKLQDWDILLGPVRGSDPRNADIPGDTLWYRCRQHRRHLTAQNGSLKAAFRSSS